MYIYSPEFRLGSNALTASATVLVLDYLLTLDEEINYMWMQPKGFGTLLFFLNRYSPFLDTLMALYTQMGVVSPERCKTLYQGITWLVATGLCMSELILLLRTFAMWNHKKAIFFILATMSTLTWGPGIAITYLEIASFRFEPVPEGAVGCRLVSASKLIWVTFILLAFSETVICILTVMKGIHHLRSSSQTWVKHVYRHGLIFYFYLLAITITNMIVPLISTQPLYKNYLAVPQRVFHSIFCNRVILVISAQRSHRAYDSMELTRQHTITKNNMTGNIDTGVVHTDASHQQFDLNELRTVDRDGDGDGDGDGDDVGVRVETYSRDWTR